MKITVNGEEREFEEGITVADLLKRLQIGGRGTAVEVNRNVIFRHEHEKTILHGGDRLEIITAVGGG